uniref:ANK_REP_REGION domain-containing protein n=1 Tax=Heterorhabditis bacteriophora TaxID=37862 RepID=A0A1I7W734_HETBA
MSDINSSDMPSKKITSLKRRASEDLRDNKVNKRLKEVFGSDVSDEDIGEVDSASLTRDSRNGSDDSADDDVEGLEQIDFTKKEVMQENKSVLKTTEEAQEGDTSDTSVEDREDQGKNVGFCNIYIYIYISFHYNNFHLYFYKNLANATEKERREGKQNSGRKQKNVPDSDKQRIKAIEREMESRGLSHPFTMESCKAFKLQREEEAELAELAKNSIIDIGEDSKTRVTRSKRAAAQSTKRRAIITEDSSDEEVEERERAKQETQSLFSNLRDIILCVPLSYMVLTLVWSHPLTFLVLLQQQRENGPEQQNELRLFLLLNTQLCHPLTGCSALHLAVLYEHHNILVILLEHRSYDIDQRDNASYFLPTKNMKLKFSDPVVLDNEWDCLFSSQSESSLTRLILQGELDLSQAPPLPQHEALYSRLALLQARLLGIWDSIQAGDDRTLKQLLCERTLAMCRDEDGRTPLHMAFKLVLFYVSSRLLKRGYQPSIEYLLYLCPEANEVKDKTFGNASEIRLNKQH